MLGKYTWRHLPGEDDGRVGLADRGMWAEFKRRLLHYLILAVICSVMIWTGLSLFLGAAYERSTRAHNIGLHVIDLDGGSIGGNVTQMVFAAKPEPTVPTWVPGPRVSSLDEAKAWVLRHGWGALVINSGATERLERALYAGASYSPTDVMTVIMSSGRHYTTEMLFVTPALITTAQTVSRQLALELVTAFQALPPQPQRQTNYVAVTNPIGYTIVDVAPAGFSIAPLMSTFGYLHITLCLVGILIPWKLSSFAFFAKVRYRDLVAMWSVLLLCTALILSLYQALAFVAFRGPNYDKLALPYTAATFFKLWFTSAGVTMACAQWMFSLFLVLTPSTVTLASIITILPNVVSTVTVVELAPAFFRIFYALPFYNGANISLRVTTGAHREAAREAGILAGEIALMVAGLALAVWIRQACLLRGISDAQGWYRGQPYYSSPIPDDKAAAQQRPPSQSQPASTASSIQVLDREGDNTRLTTGNMAG
ncbi:hypothetical protein IWQ57_001388 [Coemansia nantahalensis]|uniref:Uncharacterized protein n=1 Tax=Coemansia nantahalensis TaxID=2789366 RepID=A0ACC1K4T7_9FUNG|nr:hypothetical protein IWQ57_001388 [Coemansia nantahalensis]